MSQLGFRSNKLDDKVIGVVDFGAVDVDAEVGPAVTVSAVVVGGAVVVVGGTVVTFGGVVVTFGGAGV